MEPLSSRLPREQNRVPVMGGVNASNGTAVLPVEIDPVSGGVLVDIVAGGGGGGGSVTQGTVPWVVGALTATGAAVPANAFFMGMSDGTNLQPLRSGGSSDGVLASFPLASSGFIFNGGTTYDRIRGGQGDGAGATGLQDVVGRLFNGSTYDRQKSVATGVAAVGINDGTNTANVVAGDSGFNGVATNSGTKTLTFTTSATGAQTILANTNVEGYSWIEVVYTAVGGGLALTGQFSTISGGTYVSPSTFQRLDNGAAAVGALGVVNNAIYGSIIHGNFFQIAVSAMTSGTFTGTVTLRAAPPAPYIMQVAQSGTWTVQPGNTPNSTPWLTTNTASAAGGYSFTNISTSTTTTVKSGAGTFHLCCVNTLGTVASTCTFYDNTAGSGTVIAIINSLTLSGSFTFDIAFAIGLTVVTTGTAAPNITVAYK